MRHAMGSDCVLENMLGVLRQVVDDGQPWRFGANGGVHARADGQVVHAIPPCSAMVCKYRSRIAGAVSAVVLGIPLKRGVR